ncbi:MAG: helix-turn-helix transcriptional regulator [Synergistaceae bacterium]|nr:helix-turn-helix transcriptional regulator [Synergistaceae bacterium]
MPRWPKENKNALARIRTDAGYSRDKVAMYLKISLSTLIRYENCTTDIPIGIVEDMAVLYKVPFETLRNAIKEVKSVKTSEKLEIRS